MNRLLLIEDDERLRRALGLTLRSHGYEVVEAGSAGEAEQALGRGEFSVLVLDLGLPDLDGVELIARVRTVSAVPIVVLSARRDQSDKVHALDSGADDYLTKPFGVAELLARLRAALRRSGKPAEDLVVRTEHFTVDLGRKQVAAPDGTVIRLTPTEWGLLEQLVRARGMLVTGRDLLREVWGPQYADQSNYLRVYLAQLRRKLEPVPSHPRYLITAPGLGYRFDAS